MKSIRFMLALCTASLAARAETLTLTDGRTFTDAKVASQTPTHVTIRHGGGFQQVSKKLLPPALAEKYPLDEAGAIDAKAKDATFKQVRAQAVQQNGAQLAARRAAVLAQNEAEAIEAAEADPAAPAQKASVMFEVKTPGKKTAIGLYGVVAYFCTPEQWEAYQAKRRVVHEDEYLKHCALIRAQGYDRDGFSAANDELWRQYRRWHRSSYDEVPEHFATARTNYKGIIDMPEAPGGFVMFARSERSAGEGWDFFVWVESSSSFSTGKPKILSYTEAVRDEPWAEYPRRSPMRTGVESHSSL